MESKKIVNWLIEQSKKRGTNGFVINGDVNPVSDHLAFLLSKQTMQPTQIADTKRIIFEEEVAKGKLVVSSYDFMELNYIRPWGRFQLAADLFPFGNMYRQEIQELFVSTANMDHYEDMFIAGAYKEIDKYSEEIPFTLNELKWAHEANKRYNNILDGDDDPAKNNRWFSLTPNQKKVIAKLHQHSRQTQYKMNMVGEIF